MCLFTLLFLQRFLLPPPLDGAVISSPFSVLPLHHVRACWTPQSWFGYIRQCRSVVMPLPTDHDIPGSNPVLGLTKNKLIMKQIRWMHLQQKMPKRWELRHPKFGFYIKFWSEIAIFQLRYIFVRVSCWNHLFCLDYSGICPCYCSK